MSRLTEVGERENWRCWICDRPVDETISSNDSRGPTIDNINAATKGSKSKAGDERLAHLGCNTKRGAVKPVIPWPSELIVADQAVILTTVERLSRKGGREVVGRCMDRKDAQEAAEWLLDRISRLAPELALEFTIEQGGGQYMIALTAGRGR
ncbi:hypothetical protein EH165_05070 [Nakamurella antarctica]|uniref:HNH endonuclease n=1 Tax=Nakamurella antarctica TaxID=1902245 RepID=A0A3G8ZKA1_9ACTN|nr:hypothetical protein [Nakamurella antarctica]AZI57618.1 hypothetical protein EH165_05070 [Nakamurella antarctica]